MTSDLSKDIHFANVVRQPFVRFQDTKFLVILHLKAEPPSSGVALNIFRLRTFDKIATAKAEELAWPLDFKGLTMLFVFSSTNPKDILLTVICQPERATCQDVP